MRGSVLGERLDLDGIVTGQCYCHGLHCNALGP